MTTGKTLNLSRLSRGVGEEYPKYSHFGHHKVNVYLEPQDYFNWVERSKKVFQLPALPNVSKLSSVPHTISISANTNTTAVPVTSKEIILPKTFTTRKGALLLFSEDLANKNRTWENALEDEGEREDDGDQVARNEGQEEKQDGESSDIDLRTVGDFANSILAYGNQHRKQNYVQLLTKIDNLQRQFRPGFSAKRYLSIWSKFWDHSTLDKLLKDGHIQSKSLFQMAHLSSFHSRSLDDLSSQPLPYRLVHTMLQTNLQGYAFLRVINNQHSAAENNFAHQPYGELKVFDPGSNNQANGSQEIFYSQLDRCQQEQVLTDYLLQSTVHHAFKVQQLQFKKKTYVNITPAMKENQVVLTQPQSSAMDTGQTRTHVSMYKRPKPSVHSGLRRLGSGLLPPIMVDIKIFMIPTDFDVFSTPYLQSFSRCSGTELTTPNIRVLTHEMRQWILTNKCSLSRISEQPFETIHKSFLNFSSRYSIPNSGVENKSPSPASSSGSSSAKQHTPSLDTRQSKSKLPAKSKGARQRKSIPQPHKWPVLPSQASLKRSALKELQNRKPTKSSKVHSKASSSQAHTRFVGNIKYARERRLHAVIDYNQSHLPLNPESIARMKIAVKIFKDRSRGGEDLRIDGCALWNPGSPPLSLLDAKAHQPVINLSNLPLNEVHPCPNPEFGNKTKRRKALRAHYRQLERGKDIFLPPLVQNSAEPGSSWAASPPSTPRITGKDPETGTFFPTIIQKSGPQEPNQNPKMCRMQMLPFIQTSMNAASVPPATTVDPDEDYVNFADHLHLVPIVNIEPPTRQNSTISGSMGHKRAQYQKEYNTSEVSHDLWMSLVSDRISPTPGFWDNKMSMEELSKNQGTTEPEDVNLLKTIEATAFSSLNLNPTVCERSKMIKTSSQLMATNKAYHNQRKRPIRKGFVNVPDMKGSIVQAPGGEIVHVGGSLAHKKTVLPEIQSIAKESDKTEDELKRQQNEQSKWQTPLPDIGSHFRTSLTEAVEMETGAELRTLSSRREESSLSLISAPKVVEMLTKNAHRMASFILDQDGTGRDLDDDIKMITREVSRVLSSKNGVSLQDGNQTRMLHAENNYSQTERETGPTNTVVSSDDKGQRPSSEVSGEQGLGNILVTHSLKSSSSTSSQLTPPQNVIDGDVLSDLLGGVKPGHLYQASSRGSSPLTSASIPNQRNTVHTAIGQMEVTTLQPVHHVEPEAADNARQMNSNRTSSRESKNHVHFKLKEEENILDEDILSAHIVVRRLSQNLIQSPNSSLRSSAELRQIVEKRGSGEVNQNAREWDRERPAFVGVPPPSPEDGVSRNIIIKMPEMIQTEEYDQETSIEGPDTVSIEEETRRAMEPYQNIFGNASPNQEATEASDRKRLCSPCPDPDTAEWPPFATNTSKRSTPGRSSSQNDANINLVPKTKRGKNTPKEEFKVSRVDYAGEMKRLYSRAENTKVKMADIKHDKSKIKDRKTVKVKSKLSKKQKLSKKHKKKNKSTNKSLDEVDDSEDRSTSQWESEDRTTASGMDATGNQEVENLRQSLTSQSRNVKEADIISTWIQDAADKVASDVSDNEKGDNSGSSEPAVPEMEEKDEEDEEEDVADGQQAETSESEEQKKMMLELKRILTPRDKKIVEMPQSTETKPPEVAPYDMISSQEARAAERRARAAKRREQVERKRKEREEQLRKEKEMAERQEKLRQELEEQRRLLEEERRLRKQQVEEERRRLEEEELACELKRLQEVEAEKRRKEEHMRKLRQLKMQQREEERKQQELLRRQKEEEDERRKTEEEMLAQMAEQERIEYEKKKQEEEERRMREEEEKRIRQEAEAKQLMEEAVRLAQENARLQAEFEARFQFAQTLHAEAIGLTRCQAVTRAFVFSYFELLTLLGIENTDQQQTLLGEIP